MQKSYTISIPRKFFWKFFLPSIALACAIAFMGGVIIVDNVVMPNVVGVNRDIVSVPDIVTINYEEAREHLYKAGLLTEIKSQEYDDAIPEEAIISQFPDAGSRVKKGRKIAVVISKGKEVGVIPNVRNVSERQARILLKKAGFILGTVRKIYSSARPVDMVIDAFPKSGTTTSREIKVELYVSKGPRPTHAEVPNLVGESLKNAKKVIQDNGLTVGKITYKNNPSLLPGTIISQSSAPGSKIPFESRLSLVVSVIRK